MKNIISVIFLFLACLVLISGVTLAYFTDRSEESKIFFTTGTLEVDIDAPNNSDGWEPGKENAKNISWTFENNGSVNANLTVKIKTEWKLNEQTPNESIDNDSMEDTVNEPDVTWVQITDWGSNGNMEYVYPDLIEPGKEIELDFSLILEEMDYEMSQIYSSADYKITLTLTAVQSSGN